MHLNLRYHRWHVEGLRLSAGRTQTEQAGAGFGAGTEEEEEGGGWQWAVEVQLLTVTRDHTRPLDLFFLPFHPYLALSIFLSLSVCHLPKSRNKHRAVHSLSAFSWLHLIPTAFSWISFRKTRLSVCSWIYHIARTFGKFDTKKTKNKKKQRKACV